MTTVDTLWVKAHPDTMFQIARDVEGWAARLPHYRFVRFRDRREDGSGLVEMSANRPFGVVNWPTWWLSEMEVDHQGRRVRFKHVGGVTTGMDVEWAIEPRDGGSFVNLLHVWDGPSWPLIGALAANVVIGPVFIHGIASRTLAGLGAAAEQADASRAAP